MRSLGKSKHCMNTLALCSEVKEEVELLAGMWKMSENKAWNVIMLIRMCQEILRAEQCGRFWAGISGCIPYLLNKYSINLMVRGFTCVWELAVYFSYLKPFPPLKRELPQRYHYATWDQLYLTVLGHILYSLTCVIFKWSLSEKKWSLFSRAQASDRDDSCDMGSGWQIVRLTRRAQAAERWLRKTRSCPWGCSLPSPLRALGPAGQQLTGVDRTGCGQQPPHTQCTASAPALKACPLHPMSRIYKCRWVVMGATGWDGTGRDCVLPGSHDCWAALLAESLRAWLGSGLPVPSSSAVVICKSL